MLSLRRAVTADLGLYFYLAHDPHARAMFFAPDPPTWDEHLAWWNLPALRFVAYDDTVPIGAIWFWDETPAIVSVNLCPDARGNGFASPVIRMGSRECADEWRRPIRAYIKPDNRASVKAFFGAGYTPVGETVIEGGHKALEFAWP